MNSLHIGKIEVSLNRKSVGNLQNLLKAAFKMDFWVKNKGCSILYYVHALIKKRTAHKSRFIQNDWTLYRYQFLT